MKSTSLFWLKAGVALLTGILMFYVVEDERGAVRWAKTKAEWEAKGETFDYAKFIPPPVPDDQNLGAIPFFKLETLPTPGFLGHPTLDALRLKQALRISSGLDLPPVGVWQRGELPDMAKIQKGIAINCKRVATVETIPADTLAQFDMIYPFLDDLRAANAARSLCRFNLDYETSPPIFKSFVLQANLIKLSQVLTLHAILTLDHHQADLAIEDIVTTHKLLNGIKRDPSLLGVLVATGMAVVGDSVIYDGLAHHSWSDSQLSEFQKIQESDDFLADYQFGMRSEAAESVDEAAYFKHAPSAEVSKLFSMSDVYGIELSAFWPNGWWDQNISQVISFHRNHLASVDPGLHRAFPDIEGRLDHQEEDARARWDADAPWNFWATFASFGTMHGFAQAQVWSDETRIACGLERYWLAHGSYPDSLEALVPEDINRLPLDIFNGMSYHYRRKPNGTYLLYSVGWNQADDGGEVSPPNDYKDGDWVWPVPKPAGK